MYHEAMQRLVDVVFWISLSLWLALGVAGGIAAMAIFPTARELPISMPHYDALIAADAAQGRMTVAGHLVERVFTVSQTPRIACAAIAALALLTQIALAKKSPLGGLRLAVLAFAGGALLLGAAYAMPDFQSRDGQFRALAATPDTLPLALEMKPELDAAHERASRVATAEVGAVLALIAFSAFAAGGARRA